MGIRHPWEITLREFVEKVRRDYGIEVDTSLLDQIVIYQRDGRQYVLPKFDPDGILELPVLQSLCWIFNLPTADFSLDPEPDD